MIQVNSLSKKFGKVEVLNQLDLEIKSGGIFAVLGPNGSGKTTLIKSILGMVIADSGNISVDGKNIKNQWNYRKDINYLPQIANFPANLSVTELINMIKNLRPQHCTDERLITDFGLEKYLNQKLGNLSGGTRQKVNILLTFMFDSPIVILDEPTTGLDPISLIHLKDLIIQEKEKGKTVIITSHIMSFVEEMADEVVFLLDGKIYFKGSLSQIKNETGQDNLEHAIAHILERNID